MCRFALYLGDEILLSALVTQPSNSIIHQSAHSHLGEEPLNGDGFGVAWFPAGGTEPAVLKEVHPAWNSMNLHSLARVTRTHCVLAHVRAASPGLPVTQLNCHPFAWRSLCLMHNGGLGGFLTMKRRLQQELSEDSYRQLLGSTDSEHLFALIKDAYRGSDEKDPMKRLKSAMLAAFRRTEELRQELGILEGSYLNVALCDGRRAVVSRYASEGAGRARSLFYHQGGDYVCDGDFCRMVVADGDPGAVLVCSEPLSQDPGWDQVPENHLVLVEEDLTVTLEPIALG